MDASARSAPVGPVRSGMKKVRGCRPLGCPTAPLEVDPHQQCTTNRPSAAATTVRAAASGCSAGQLAARADDSDILLRCSPAPPGRPSANVGNGYLDVARPPSAGIDSARHVQAGAFRRALQCSPARSPGSSGGPVSGGHMAMRCHHLASVPRRHARGTPTGRSTF